MPANVVKTDRDEHLWDQAKKQAKKQNRAKDYAYIMGIFQRMKGVNKSDVIPGGLAEGKTPDAFDPESLAVGIKVELEHTDNEEIAREIAMDHLTEDPDYYVKLAQIETKKSLTAELDAWLEKSATPPPGFKPVKRSKRGGYVKIVGGKRVYWYPEKTKKRKQSTVDYPKHPEDVDPDVRYMMFERHPTNGQWMVDRSFYGTYFRPNTEGELYFRWPDKYRIVREGLPAEPETPIETERPPDPPELRRAAKDLFREHKNNYSLMTPKEQNKFKRRVKALQAKVDPQRDVATQMSLDNLYTRMGIDMDKSIAAIRTLCKAGEQKPPAGFTPIPKSTKGGFHMKRGGGYIYWYPGVGVTNAPHSEDKGKIPKPKPTNGKQAKDKPADKKRTVITDPSELPQGFNDLPKKERALMTADYDVVKDEMKQRFGEPKKYSGDLKQSISDHLDEMGAHGHIIPKNVEKAKEMLHKMVDYGMAAGVDEKKLMPLMEENVRKLAHQEIESVSRTLGDHGVRHLSVNAKQSDAIFEQLKKGGKDVTPMDHFKAYQVWLDHDMGYAIPAIARGGFAVKDNYHPQASTVMSHQQADKYKAIFGEDGFTQYVNAVANHSGSEVDWRGDYFGSAVRLADNSHLFADKMPEVLFDSKEAIETLVKVRIAAEHVPKTGEADEKGKRKRTPEEKAQLKSLLGGVKATLIKAIEARDDLPHESKAKLIKASREIGELTPKFLIGRLAGRSPKFDFDGNEMRVDVEQSDLRQTIGEVFGMDNADGQFLKLLDDYGIEPQDALNNNPPPQAQCYVGDKGNGIEFLWRPPTNEHHAERRHSEVMKSVHEEWKDIQKLDGADKEAAETKFFGTDIAKALNHLRSMSDLDAWLEKSDRTLTREMAALEKASAMSALAARTGRTRPSAYRPTGVKQDTSAKPGLGTRVASKLGMKPSGGGWSPIPGGSKGGFRKLSGGKWVYWYPGMKQGASQETAERHQAKKDFEHHTKQSDKWRERAAKRQDAGHPREAIESARNKMHFHHQEAQKLADKHGFGKSMKSTPRKIARIGIGECYADLSADEMLSKAINSDGMQVGVQNRNNVMQKGTIYQGEATDKPCIEEDLQRQIIAAQIIESDPAGFGGQGGLPEWWVDAHQPQKKTQVIDDSSYEVRQHFTKLDY